MTPMCPIEKVAPWVSLFYLMFWSGTEGVLKDHVFRALKPLALVIKTYPPFCFHACQWPRNWQSPLPFQHLFRTCHLCRGHTCLLGHGRTCYHYSHNWQNLQNGTPGNRTGLRSRATTKSNESTQGLENRTFSDIIAWSRYFSPIILSPLRWTLSNYVLFFTQTMV